MVHEPSGIMVLSSAKSLSAKLSRCDLSQPLNEKLLKSLVVRNDTSEYKSDDGYSDSTGVILKDGKDGTSFNL